MILNPHGPAALIEKASGTTPAWAVDERQLDADMLTFVYRPKYLTAASVAEVSALTDPRVGWDIEIRPTGINSMRIRARKETP